ncbi:hypothetical protein [Streptomyces clavuligerus]|uniref:hypothetical protein n=1 Tax=Streptomyces clavuligerus TaxID=1901 RepID=UPI00017FF590|nr:hypothetical protein [Streptomyces clavuligerus]EDY49187.1 hypothetical protein SSCG_02215 [Streptomyces clavuligerus]WDN56107.1 hypothetical protein LL058_30045 [Streptomyces clavuligerus]
MSKQKFMTRITVAGAALMLSLGSATFAQAAPSEPHGTQSEAAWRFVDDYWTWDGCQAAGYLGRDRGEWYEFQCRPSAVDWNLWANYL